MFLTSPTLSYDVAAIIANVGCFNGFIDLIVKTFVMSCVCVCVCVGSLPDSLTDGVDEMKELEEQEMSILQDVLK